MDNESGNEAIVINEVSEYMDRFVSHFKGDEEFKIIEETDDKVVFEYSSEENGGQLLYPFDEWTMFSIEQGDRIEIIRVDTEGQTWRRAPEFQHVLWPWRDKSQQNNEIEVVLTTDANSDIDINSIKSSDIELSIPIQEVQPFVLIWLVILKRENISEKKLILLKVGKLI